MKRIVILGRGASGKTTAAMQLAQLTGLPVLKLDEHFWSPDLAPTPAAWRNRHAQDRMLREVVKRANGA